MSNSNHRVRLAHPVSLLDVVNLRSDPIPVLIRRLALPASIGMVFSVLLNVTDTFYAGMLSSTALAALSLAGPVFFLVMTLGIGIGQATNALVGNRLGSDDMEGARGMAMQSISFAVIVSVLAAAVTLWATPWLFALMGGEGEYLNEARAYINIVLTGTVLFSLSLVLNSILNTRGDTVSYRNAQIVAFVANIGLDPLFMFIFGLGVSGVAVATICVQAGVVAWLSLKVSRLDFLQGVRWAEFVPSTKRFVEIARQSVPSSASMLLVAVGSLIIVAYVARFGEEAMAAYGVALRIEQLILLLIIGINIAALSLTGVNYGAGDLARVQEIYKTALRYTMSLMAVGAVVLVVFAGPLMALFSDEAAVRDIGVTYLYFEAMILPAYAVTFLSASMLQGLKRPEIALYFNIVRQVLAQLLLFWIAIDVLGAGLTGIWWSVLVINWVLALLIFLAVRSSLRRVADELQPTMHRQE